MNRSSKFLALDNFSRHCYVCLILIKFFQQQEKERFENPHKAYTYRMHGYESVVGPVKGIYNTQTSSSVLKPRGHNLLALNRPSYVTILALGN